MLLRSQGRCLKCGDLLASVYVHDFKTCSCGAFSLDGGRDYTRVCGNPRDFELLPVTIKEDLPLVSAGHALMVLKTLERIAPHDNPTVWKPARAVNDLLGFVLWERRGSIPGELYRNVPTVAMTRKWLNLLLDNGLVERRLVGRAQRWRSLTELAPPLDY